MRKFSRVSKLLTTDETIIIRREQQGLGDDIVLVNGRQIVRDAIYFSVPCCVQVIQGDDVILEAAGNRSNDQMYFYAWDQDNKLRPNDYLWRRDNEEDEGGWYVAQACETWGSYTRVRGQRVDMGFLAPSNDLLQASDSFAPSI